MERVMQWKAQWYRHHLNPRGCTLMLTTALCWNINHTHIYTQQWINICLAHNAHTFTSFFPPLTPYNIIPSGLVPPLVFLPTTFNFLLQPVLPASPVVTTSLSPPLSVFPCLSLCMSGRGPQLWLLHTSSWPPRHSSQPAHLPSI